MPSFKNPEYTLVNTKKDFVKYFEILMNLDTCFCDSETNSFRHVDGHIIGLSFSWKKWQGIYIPLRHDTGEKNLDPEFAFKWLKEFYEDESVTTCWWNAKFDFKFLRREETGSIVPRGRFEDGMHMAHLLNENEPKKLKWQAKEYIHPDANKYEVLVDEYRKAYARKIRIPDETYKRGWRQMKKDDVAYDVIPFEIMVPYAASDTDYTLQRTKALYRELKQDGALMERYEYELRLNWAYTDIEDRGVLLDSKYLVKQSKKAKKKLKKAEKKLFKKAGREVNIGSPKQLVELFKEKGIPIPMKRRKNGTESPSVDADALGQLASKGHKLPKYILKYREHTKRKSTYFDALPLLVQSDGAVHGSNNTAGARTGRSSMADPNLMNQPRGPLVRSAFVVPDGFFWVKKDYNQVELRVAGAYSGDDFLLGSYNSGQDVHKLMAQELVAMSGEDWDSLSEKDQKERRRRAKAVNFGFLFDMQGPSFVNYARSQYDLILTPEEGEEYHSTFHEKLAGYSAWMKEIKRAGMKEGEVISWFGRRRRTPALLDPATKHWQRNGYFRQLINALVQGSAGDIFKVATVRVYEYLQKMNASTRIVIQVHDELDFYWHKDELELMPEVDRLMEDFDIGVPLLVETEWGMKNWGNLTELSI